MELGKTGGLEGPLESRLVGPMMGLGVRVEYGKYRLRDRIR